jgi:hypothetical protein
VRKWTNPSDWIADIPTKNRFKDHCRSFSLISPTRIITCKSKSAINKDGCGKKNSNTNHAKERATQISVAKSLYIHGTCMDNHSCSE